VKVRTWLLLLASFLPAMSQDPSEIVALTSARPSYPARFTSIPFPSALLNRMREASWHTGCPVPIEDLRLLNLSYWDFNGIPRQGLLIVHKNVAADVQYIFQRLFQHGFLIERMQTVEVYGGSDDASMAANNTSSFNCRDVTGSPGRFSNHSWGRAIDINPLTNPMVLHGKPLPPEGARYLNRGLAWPGSIFDGSFIVKLFRERGWTWGGEWSNPDYQHFEKPAAGQKVH
jgi:hypothetical protein